MSEYPKIQSVFKRDPENNHRTFLTDVFADPTFEYLAGLPWEGTEKVDGTNIRIYKQRPDQTASPIAGKSDRAQLPPKLEPVLADIRSVLVGSDLPDGTCLYGEGYGSSIQRGGHYRDDVGFVLFDVTIDGRWQPRSDVDQIAEDLGIAAVPVLDHMPLRVWVDVVADGAKHLAGGGDAGPWFTGSRLHTGARNEGVVLRPLVELADRHGRRVASKLKFRDFPS